MLWLNNAANNFPAYVSVPESSDVAKNLKTKLFLVQITEIWVRENVYR